MIYLPLSWNILLYCIQQLLAIEIEQFKFHVYFLHLMNVVENSIIGTYFIMLDLVRSNKTELLNHRLDHYAYWIRTAGHNPNENWYYFVGRFQTPSFFINDRIIRKHIKSDRKLNISFGWRKNQFHLMIDLFLIDMIIYLCLFMNGYYIWLGF